MTGEGVYLVDHVQTTALGLNGCLATDGHCQPPLR